MVRFANDCLGELPRITSRLSNSLGSDTINLQLRVGLNSGPTTAGVLRGEKARFQLFGDTVNTAARMESNGAPGRIQVSQATADLLIAAGKASWLTERQDMVEAKGKGKLQTYWVQIIASIGVSSTKPSEIDQCSEHNKLWALCSEHRKVLGQCSEHNKVLGQCSEHSIASGP